jgi:hypothetical protein
MVENPERALESLRANPAISNNRSNHHGFLGAMNCYVRDYLVPNDKKWIPIHKIWNKELRENGKVFSEHRDKGEPTELQKDKVVQWSDVIKIRDELPIGIPKLLLGFYSYIPPIRGDLYDCEIIREGETAPTDKNHLIIGDDYTLILVDYKTKSAHGRIEIVLPKPLRDLYNACVYKKLIGSHLFMGRFGKPYNRSSFGKFASQVLTETIGKPTSLLMLRYSYLSSLNMNQSNKVLKDIADKMGHTLGSQRGYKLDLDSTKNELIMNN